VNVDEEEEEGGDSNKSDGRRRRSVVTNERKQAFGRKNEKLNERKVAPGIRIVYIIYRVNA
jgi:hypothetical protein